LISSDTYGNSERQDRWSAVRPSHIRSRPACSSRHLARETRARTRRSRLAASIRSLLVTRQSRQPCHLATRIAIICDNFSPHLTTRKDARVGTWAKTNNVEIA